MGLVLRRTGRTRAARTRARSRAARRAAWSRHVHDRAHPAEPHAPADRREDVPPVERRRPRRSRGARARGRAVAQRRVVQRRDVPEPHARRRTASTANAGWARNPARRSTAVRRRVTGRSSTFVRPRISRIGAMSSSSMCWTMCITISWSPSASSGETSATRIAQHPAGEQRQPAVARRVRLAAACGRGARPRGTAQASATTDTSAVGSNVQADRRGQSQRHCSRSTNGRATD